MESLLVNKKTACLLLGQISDRTLSYMISAKILPVRRIGKRIMFERRVLEEFVKHDHNTGRNLPRHITRLAQRIDNS